MEFKYTNTWEEFKEYSEELYCGYLNRYRKGWGKSWEYEMQRHYVAEMEFIRSKVKEKPDTVVRQIKRSLILQIKTDFFNRLAMV